MATVRLAMIVSLTRGQQPGEPIHVDLVVALGIEFDRVTANVQKWWLRRPVTKVMII
jgi:hypothetical protein